MTIERTVKPPESGSAIGWEFRLGDLRTYDGDPECAVWRDFASQDEPLYATESDALRALREAVEAEAAEQLRRIDERIAALEEE